MTDNREKPDAYPNANSNQEVLVEYIKLDQFLKLANLVETGGQAKFMIQNGEVRVNGEVETRRGRKLIAGDVVEVDGETLVVETEQSEAE